MEWEIDQIRESVCHDTRYTQNQTEFIVIIDVGVVCNNNGYVFL